MASLRQIGTVALVATLSAGASLAASDRTGPNVGLKSAQEGTVTSSDSSDPLKDWMSREHTYYERQGNPEILW